MNRPAPDVKSIFGLALQIESPAERAAHLDAACAGDARLREEVESLLRAHDQAGSFPHRPADPGGVTGLHVPKEAGPGEGSIGPYRLLQKLGEGGMGVVYEAEQTGLIRRRVALKVIKPDIDSETVRGRFETERQAMALMDHPNIPKVLHAGETEAGRPFFVMELVRGKPITKYCDDRKLRLNDRLELFVAVCQAVQHAHSKRIIHRDLKPDNIHLMECDDRPVVKVLDFGIAKGIDQPLSEGGPVTVDGAALGTWAYMSPEQAEGSRLGIDRRTDIYSLGVVLYELLTGTTPLEARRLGSVSVKEVLRLICEEEPPRPSTRLRTSGERLAVISQQRRIEPAELPRLVKGELDWIVMKCLEKDRNRRYDSASDLARDVQNYLAGDPVEACPPSLWYVLSRLMRKYRRAVIAGAAFVLLLMTAVAVSSWLAVEAGRQRSAADEARRKASDERDRALASQKELRMALTRQVAERLEKDQAQFAMLGQALAAMMAVREDWKEEQLQAWMKAMLEREERIFGLWVAFERDQFPHKEGYYSLYTSRKTGQIQTEQLLPPPEGKYDYPTLPFYLRARQTGRAFVTEPLFDEHGANTWILVRYVPFERKGRVVGVVTVDLSVRYFRVLRDWLERELKLGEGSYGFIISHDGKLISHPRTDEHLWRHNPQPRPTHKTPPPEVTDLPGIDPTFRALVDRIQKGEDGTARAIDPTTGKEATFLFVPIRSLGWTFVAVVPAP